MNENPYQSPNDDKKWNAKRERRYVDKLLASSVLLAGAILGFMIGATVFERPFAGAILGTMVIGVLNHFWT